MTITAQRIVRMPVALAIGCAAALVGFAPDASAKAPDAAVRAAHLSPTTAGVDVYLGKFSGGHAPKRLWLNKVTYGSVTQYQPITPGLYTVAMRPAGAPAAVRPMLTWTLDAKPGAAYTVAGIGAGSSVRGVVFKDNLSSPPRGDGRVRVIQAASRAPVATVSATGGHVIVHRAHFASVSSYQTLPAGKWTVKAFATSTPSVSTSSPVDVRNGQITSIVLLDAKTAGITLRTVADASSSGVMPSAAVDAGAGGTAGRLVGLPQPAGVPWAWIAMVALILGATVTISAGRPTRRVAPANRRRGRHVRHTAG